MGVATLATELYNCLYLKRELMKELIFYKFRKSYFNYLVGLLKNGRGLLGHGTLKFSLSQE